MRSACLIAASTIVGALAVGTGCGGRDEQPLPVAPSEGSPPLHDSLRSIEDGLVPGCDRYVKAMRSCVESLSGDRRETARRLLDDHVDALETQVRDGATRDAIGDACISDRNRSKALFATGCPEVVWD